MVLFTDAQYIIAVYYQTTNLMETQFPTQLSLSLLGPLNLEFLLVVAVVIVVDVSMLLLKLGRIQVLDWCSLTQNQVIACSSSYYY